MHLEGLARFEGLVSLGLRGAFEGRVHLEGLARFEGLVPLGLRGSFEGPVHTYSTTSHYRRTERYRLQRTNF